MKSRNLRFLSWFGGCVSVCSLSFFDCLPNNWCLSDGSRVEVVVWWFHPIRIVFCVSFLHSLSLLLEWLFWWVIAFFLIFSLVERASRHVSHWSQFVLRFSNFDTKPKLMHSLTPYSSGTTDQKCWRWCFLFTLTCPFSLTSHAPLYDGNHQQPYHSKQITRLIITKCELLCVVVIIIRYMLMDGH